MKLKLEIDYDKNIGDDYEVSHIIVLTDNTNKLCFVSSDLSECPEDAILGRSLITGYDIINICEFVHKATKNNEELEIEIIKNE